MFWGANYVELVYDTVENVFLLYVRVLIEGLILYVEKGRQSGCRE